MNLKNIMLLATVSACWAQYDGSSESGWFDHLDPSNHLLVSSFMDDFNKNGFYSRQTQKTNKKRKKLELSAVFVAFDTEHLKCKIETCENLKANGGNRICHRHKMAKLYYERNPSIENKKFCDELLDYQKQLMQLRNRPPQCKKCGETNEKKFYFIKKENKWCSWCRRCRKKCHEHSTLQKQCWISSCVQCKLAGKNTSQLCHAEEFCDKTVRNHAIFGLLCRRCFEKKNPDHEFVRFQREKEYTFHEVLKSMLLNITICPTFHVPVTLPNGKTGRKFVDFRIETPHLIIDMELDENQHKIHSYDTPQERMRSDLIYQASRSSGKKYIMLRFNPDEFTAKNGNKLRSCFAKPPGAKPYISDESQWKLRTSYFKSRLEECMQFDPNNLEIFPHVEYMFFDDFDTSTFTFDASSHVRKQKRKHVDLV